MRRNDVVKAMFSIWKHSKEGEKDTPKAHSYYYGIRVAITTLAAQIDVRDDLDSLIFRYLSKQD